jgi:uncharacterized protein (TIGR03435 family)
MGGKHFFQRLVCFMAFSSCSSVYAQGAAPSQAFDSASVKPAAEDAETGGTTFMIGLENHVPPHGLLRMTTPLAPLIMFAYGVDDEVEARAMRARLPGWAQHEKFTIVARAPQDAPTLEEIRLMMRGLLEDRFALKVHRDTHSGPVDTLSVSKPGMPRPNMKAHDASRICVRRGSAEASEPGKPASVYCGLELHQTGDGMFHVTMIDVSLPEACTLLGGLGGVVGGRGMKTVVDGTGLQGHWDLTLDFLAERNGPSGEGSTSDVGGPSFTAALEKQLGLRLKKGTGTVEELIVDHIAEPTAD